MAKISGKEFKVESGKEEVATGGTTRIGRQTYASDLDGVKTRAECELENKRLLFRHEINDAPPPLQGRRASYREEGNFDLETATAKQQRRKLKKHDGIRANITLFWKTFTCVRSKEQIFEGEGIHVLTLFMKALYDPEDFDLEDVQKIAKEDWDAERARSRNKMKFMQFDDFYELLFEVVLCPLCFPHYVANSTAFALVSRWLIFGP
jgi:hypothetical protein